MDSPVAQTAFPIPSYIPQFDGLRGLSILAVFVAHSSFLRSLPHASFLEYGRVGVDLFFVLSGFLITGILLDTKSSHHYFRNFYARRALRIWPLYYVMLILVLGLCARFTPNASQQVKHAWPYFFLYLQNLRPHLFIPFGLEPTWSLAIEEQFYLTWPMLIFVFKRRVLVLALVGAVVLSLALRIFGFEHGASLKFIHNFTFCRLDAIALGSLSAIWLRSGKCTTALWRRYSLYFLLAGGAGVIASRILFHQQSTVISYTFLAIGFTGFLGMALISENDGSVLKSLLNRRWLCGIGKISYGLYLLHMPLFLIFESYSQGHPIFANSAVLRNLTWGSAQVLAAFVAAAISWHFFESPILRLKSSFPRQQGIALLRSGS